MQVKDKAGNLTRTEGRFAVLPGDVNGSIKVDLFDLFRIGKAFDSKPGDGNWNPDANINSDGKIDLMASVITGKTPKKCLILESFEIKLQT